MVEALAVAVTVLGYTAARKITDKWRWGQPLLWAVGLTGAAWWIGGGEWEPYASGTTWISWWLGPATVALAVPLAKQWRELAARWQAIAAGVGVGCLVSLLSTWGWVMLLAGEEWLLRTLLSRSVTTPISVELTHLLGGNPALAALFTALTGLIGISMARPLLRLARVRSDWAIGIAVGSSSHAIGTASLLANSEQQAAASSLAMIVAGVITSVLLMPLYG